MTSNRPNPIRDLLLEHYLNYQRKENRRVPVKEFSEYIGLSYSFYNHLFNGTRDAGLNTINQLALFFNDPRFYDAAGFPRPDPLVNDLSLVVGKLNSKDRKVVSDVISKYILGKE